MEADKQVAGEVALRFLSGPLAEKTIAVQQQVIMIGRDRQNDVVVLDPSISRQHARIRWQRDAWTIDASGVDRTANAVGLLLTRT